MWTSRVTAFLCIFFSVLACAWGDSTADYIRFKKGGAQQCVIIEESEESVEFLSPMGVVKMSMEKIGSIERQPDDVNAALKEKWSKKNRRPPTSKSRRKPKPMNPQAPKSLRTYHTEIARRTIALGGKTSAAGGGQQVADFVIDDMGSVKGNRLFEVSVTSHRIGSRRITSGSFHVLYRNGLRIDPKSLKGFAPLDATLNQGDKATGYVAFPTNGVLETLVVRSDIADFDLDLETGNFSIKRGPF
jgi:hypothetical protein